EQSVFKAVRQAADRHRELAIDRIAGAAGRGRVMRLVEDQQGAGSKIAEEIAQSADIGFIRHQRMRGEESRAGSPWVGAIATLPTQDGEVVAIDDRERKAKL